MGILARLRGGGPQASISARELEQVLRGAGAFAPTKSGVPVTPESALRVATYFACVRVLAEDIAKLPLLLYRRRADGGRDRATDHPLYRLMHLRPNDWQTSFGFRETAQAHLGMRGNAYAFINRVGGRIHELVPLHPDRVQPKQDPDYTIWYEVDRQRREAHEILHVSGLSLDGVTGVSVATYARETLGLAVATETHGARLFAQGALFRGILQHPKALKDEKVGKRIRESFDEAFRGEGAHQTALLEEGMTYEKVSMTAEDSQFLGTREFQAHEIARWFRMPPHKVGLLEKATFSNIEHQALEYVVDTLLPWLVRWEQRCTASLLTEGEQDEYFFEFLVDGLLRGDQAARYKAYKDAVLTGFMSRNEVRAKENLNPIEGLDEFLTPLNMAAAGQEEADR